MFELPLTSICPYTHNTVHINLQAANSDVGLNLWAHALGSWFTDVASWDGGSITSINKRPRPVANKVRGPIPCAFPSAAWGNLSEKTFKVQAAAFRSHFFLLQLVDGWACEVQFAWLNTEPGQLTKCYWWTGRWAQEWNFAKKKRDMKFAWVFLGHFRFTIFFQHVYGLEFFFVCFFTQKKTVLAMWQFFLFFVFFFIKFKQVFLTVGRSKIVFYVSVNFRTLKCYRDYWRGAATDIRSPVKSYHTAFLQRDREQWIKEINWGQCYSYDTPNCGGHLSFLIGGLEFRSLIHLSANPLTDRSESKITRVVLHFTGTLLLWSQSSAKPSVL